MWTRLILFSLLLCASTEAQSLKRHWDFRWADPKADKWYTDDKGFHCFGSAYLFQAINKKKSVGTSALFTLGLGAVWEVKDGYIRYEDVPFFGGDGFSYKDLIADAVGIGFGIIIDAIRENSKNSKQKSLERIRKSRRVL